MQQVVVVGAGVSGLTTIKACLEENLEVVCFEKTNNIGGLWHYREEVIEGVGSVMRSTIMNTSKEMSAFSDFPPPENFPMYMHNKYAKEYLEMYAQYFGLSKYVMLQHTVMAVTKSADDNWIVSVLNQKTGKEFQVVSQFLFVCTGTNAFPNLSRFPGMDDFNGSVLNCHSFKHTEGFNEKTVLVIGAGHSGADIAVELSHVCKKVYLSMKDEGCWVLPRLVQNGYPSDMFFIKRFISLALSWIPKRFQNAIAEYMVSRRLDHNLFGFCPKRHFYEGSKCVINDEICNRLTSGTLVLKGEVDHFTRTGVVFQQDSGQVHNVDVIVIATGYTVECSFLKGANLANDIHDTYKFVFPLGQSKPTVAFIGYIFTLAPLFPVFEMQARWAVQTFLKRCTLPSDDEMRNDILNTRRQIVSVWGTKATTWSYANYIPYLDFIGKAIGVKPCYLKMLFRDPCLFMACMFGPFLPYQFRLQGLHTWAGARDAIMNVSHRIETSLRTRISSD